MGSSRRRSSRELHEDVVRAVEVEIASGRTRRDVATSMGLNRKTVNQIAAGLHVSQKRGRRYQRCPEGHLTLLPCRTCDARQEAKARAKPKNSAA